MHGFTYNEDRHMLPYNKKVYVNGNYHRQTLMLIMYCNEGFCEEMCQHAIITKLQSYILRTFIATSVC